MIKENTSGNVEHPHKGLFVVFEGGEGSGKSTQARLLSKALCALGVHNHLTHEPGDTELGTDLRNLLLKRGRNPMSMKAEALLFAADRAEHVEKLIRPSLDRGDVVICDRYMASTIAYQGFAGGLVAGGVEHISNWASGSLYPDITFLLDIDPKIGLARAKTRGDQTHFEDEEIAFHDCVRMGFLSQRALTWITIDATDSVHEIHKTIVMNTLMVYQEVLSRADKNSSDGIRDGVPTKIV